MRDVMIVCQHCDGHGTVKLSPRLREVLILVPFDGSLATAGILRAVNVGRGHPIKLPALIGRLRMLAELGLVAKHEAARGHEWRRI